VSLLTDCRDESGERLAMADGSTTAETLVLRAAQSDARGD